MTDYIDREAVIDYIRYKVCQGEGNIEHRCNRGSCAYCGICEIMCDISSMPAADVQPVKRGKWIEHNDWIECNVCRFEVNDIYCEKRNMACTDTSYDYCPKCGADMRNE